MTVDEHKKCRVNEAIAASYRRMLQQLEQGKGCPECGSKRQWSVRRWRCSKCGCQPRE